MAQQAAQGMVGRLEERLAQARVFST